MLVDRGLGPFLGDNLNSLALVVFHIRGFVEKLELNTLDGLRTKGLAHCLPGPGVHSRQPNAIHCMGPFISRQLKKHNQQVCTATNRSRVSSGDS